MERERERAYVFDGEGERERERCMPEHSLCTPLHRNALSHALVEKASVC